MEQNVFEIPEKTIVFNGQFFGELFKKYQIRFNGDKEAIAYFTTTENTSESFGKGKFFLLSDLTKEYGLNSMTVPELMDVPSIPKSKHLSKSEAWRVIEYALNERKNEIRSDGHFLSHVGFVKIPNESNDLGFILASILILNHSDVGETIILLTTDLTHPKIGWIKRVGGVIEE